MAKHLTDNDIARIIELLDGWSGKLTWDLLCETCPKIIGTLPTRQTLSSYTRIKSAFKLRKNKLAEEEKTVRKPSSLAVAGARITRLEQENERLKHENQQLLEQFVVWQYNAYAHGMTDVQLNHPLPVIDREPTK